VNWLRSISPEPLFSGRVSQRPAQGKSVGRGISHNGAMDLLNPLLKVGLVEIVSGIKDSALRAKEVTSTVAWRPWFADVCKVTGTTAGTPN
jgi:hypothetical protein